MLFKDLGIIEPILKAILFEGYETPSPIQELAIPVLLEKKDVLASAQTGTGKTAAFSIPIIQGLYENKDNSNQRRIQALVLAPTRELAEQIKDSFRSYSRQMGLKIEVVYGGVSQRNQEIALKKGIDILIATPGRLLDLIGQNLIHLDNVKYFVLDEADRMLDMGFINDVRKIVKFIKHERQTMLFSATMPNEILKLANELLINPVRIEVTPPEAMIDKISHSLYFVTKKDKVNLLIDLLVNPKLASVLVFTRTKHGANKLVKELLAYGVNADAIHGNKSQNKRQKALLEFKSKKLRVLVATDIAARGIDVDDLTHVVNYDLPETPETYIHRIGRTGRAGQSGIAISFCSQEEVHLLTDIEKTNKITIPVVQNHLFQTTVKVGQTKKEVKELKSSPNTQNRKQNNGKQNNKNNDSQKKHFVSKIEQKRKDEKIKNKDTENTDNLKYKTSNKKSYDKKSQSRYTDKYSKSSKDDYMSQYASSRTKQSNQKTSKEKKSN